MKRYLYWLLCVSFAFGWVMVSENRVQAGEVAMVTMMGSGELAFISIEKENVIKTIRLQAPLPGSIAITPDNQTAIVTCFTGHICFIDIEKMECLKTLKLLSGPEQHGVTLQPNEFADLCITKDGKTALVTEGNELGQIFMLDIATMALSGEPFYLGDEPDRIIINSNTIPHETYVLDNGSIHILKGDDTYDFIDRPTGNDEIPDFALTPDGSRAIFIDSDNWVYLISTTTWSILDQKQVNENRFTEPSQVAVSPDGTLAIITNSTDQSITFVTITSNSLNIEQTIPVNGTAEGVAFTQDGQTAVVTVMNTGFVKIIDIPGRQVRATVNENLGLGPCGVTIVDINPEPEGNQTCEGDFDSDGDVDGSDSATFAADFGRTNCGACCP